MRNVRHTLLLILYCTGLRFGEAVRLNLSDVDLEIGQFYIRESKGRARFVPFGVDLVEKIKAYVVERSYIAVVAQSDVLFIRRNGSPLTIGSASDAVRRLFRKLGLKPAHGRIGPRPYDFRYPNLNKIQTFSITI